eukprot:CAMPEP_0168785458 /NCGR_PEP_ID=MMETSP0725-20121227/10760_1 /TAXON_ID=265536 /ORGANISM="Amphiprora sp., Strain CCMP467" /LENGTH=317 /DNA_ID=CAMNT_0008835563 /DNA_START=97 /DNA_END=1047 /DNA_ORIENTATION=-
MDPTTASSTSTQPAASLAGGLNAGSHHINIHLDHPPHSHHHHHHNHHSHHEQLPHQKHQQQQQGPLPHTASYYRNCTIGGALSSSLRWLLNPIDSVKCNMQVHPKEFPSKSVTAGLQTLYNQGRMYRGVTATMLAYGHQTGMKYPLYEYNKHVLTEMFPQLAEKNKTLIYLLASGSAEAIADVFMCPWEIIKVQLQTSTANSTRGLGAATLALWRQPSPLYSAMTPIWLRQVPGTLVNFVCFEHSVQWIYQTIVFAQQQQPHRPNMTKQDCSTTTQLAVTFGAGYISGIVSGSGIISHPFDSLVSLQSRHPKLGVLQ